VLPHRQFSVRAGCCCCYQLYAAALLYDMTIGQLLLLLLQLPLLVLVMLPSVSRCVHLKTRHGCVCTIELPEQQRPSVMDQNYYQVPLLGNKRT